MEHHKTFGTLFVVYPPAAATGPTRSERKGCYPPIIAALPLCCIASPLRPPPFEDVDNSRSARVAPPLKGGGGGARQLRTPAQLRERNRFERRVALGCCCCCGSVSVCCCCWCYVCALLLLLFGSIECCCNIALSILFEKRRGAAGPIRSRAPRIFCRFGGVIAGGGASTGH